MKINKIKICVVGAANVDITGFTKDKLILKDSNIGKMEASPGGVGRNIAENLQKLDFNVSLLSIFGDDPLSEYIKKSCIDKGIKIDNSFFLNNASAATFIAIINELNDLAVGIAAMDIYECISEKKMPEKLQSIVAHEYVVIETNYPAKILEQIVNYKGSAKFVLDTVSGDKALRAKNILSKIFILKTNLLEAKIISGLQAETDEDLKKIVSYFLEKGVKNVFITLGKNGVIYGNEKLIKKQKPIEAEVLNTVGAGDAFVAGLIYADASGLDIHKTARMGMASASINVKSKSAVSPEMNIENLTKIFNKND